MRELLAVLALSMAVALGAAAFAPGAAPAGEGGVRQSASSVRHEDGPAAPERPAGPWLHIVARLVATAGVAALLVVAVLLFFENRFVFRPTREPLLSWQPPGLDVEECQFRTRDGYRLHGWWHPGSGPGEPSHRPVVLWCHGNAGNITHRAENMRMLAERGLAVLLFDYRGFGRSEGKPSEHGLYLDATTAYRYLVHRRGVSPSRVICFGRSIGTGVALHVALREKVAGLIMESAFENVPAMVRRRPLLWLPALFMRNRFDNLIRIRRLAVPLLMTHGDRDSLVPVEQGRAVFAAAPEPKELYVIEGAGPNDTYEAGGEAYFEALRRFCYRCVERKGH